MIMDYEKAYKEALNRAKLLKDNPDKVVTEKYKTIHASEIIFPELRESEDVKIKKDLIEWFKDFPDKVWWGHYTKDIVAWLEKQNEQKPIEETESKFHDGNWIVYENAVWKVCNIGLQSCYELLKINNEVSTRLIKEVDENAHLWTIADAKDGDIVISWDNKPFIYNDFFNETYVGAYCGLNTFNRIIIADKQGYLKYSWTINNNIKPATKEQRDFLFQKMREAGYEWDSESKQLIRIY